MSVPKSMRFTVFVKFDSTGRVTVDKNEVTVSLKSMLEGGKANRFNT